MEVLWTESVHLKQAPNSKRWVARCPNNGLHTNGDRALIIIAAVADYSLVAHSMEYISDAS